MDMGSSGGGAALRLSEAACEVYPPPGRRGASGRVAGVTLLGILPDAETFRLAARSGPKVVRTGLPSRAVLADERCNQGMPSAPRCATVYEDGSRLWRGRGLSSYIK